MLNKCLQLMVEKRTIEVIDLTDTDKVLKELHDKLSIIFSRLKTKMDDDLQAVDDMESIVNLISKTNIEISYSFGFYDGLKLGRDMSCPNKGTAHLLNIQINS